MRAHSTTLSLLKCFSIVIADILCCVWTVSSSGSYISFCCRQTHKGVHLAWPTTQSPIMAG